MNIYEKYLNDFSYTARRNKELLKFNQEYEKYLKMEEKEFLMEFINTQARYKNKQTLLATISIATLVAIVLDVWKYFFNALSIILVSNISDEITRVSSYLAFALTGTMLLIVIVVIYDMLKQLHKLSKKVLFLEEVKGMRNVNHSSI